MFWRILLLVILCLLLLVLVAALGIARYVMTGKRQTYEEAFEWQKAHLDTSWFDKGLLKNYKVRGSDGYEIAAYLYPNPDNTDKYIIISHGYTDNIFGNLKYMKIYLDLGFNIVMYDLRGHGLNEKSPTTYGVLESVDLLHIIEDTRFRYPDLKVLGLHGESLGAATTVTCLKYRPMVDFVVADCPFADIDNVLRAGVHHSPIAPVMIALGSLGSLLRYNISFDRMQPVLAVADNDVPMLLIHGGADDFIVPENSYRIAGATKGKSTVVIIEGAGHAASVIKDPVKYRAAVTDFLSELKI